MNIKKYVLIFVLIILFSISVRADPPFNLQDNLIETNKITVYTGSWDDAKNDYINYRLQYDFNMRMIKDDGNIASSKHNRDACYVLDNGIAYELTLGNDYIVWFEDFEKGRVNATNYIKRGNKYIFIFENVTYGLLHVGKDSDIWTSPIYTVNGFVYYPMKQFQDLKR